MYFPEPNEPTEDGVIAIGGDFRIDILLEAYGKGIFPWPHEGLPLLWFSPDPRGILDFEDFHVPESLRKFARRHSDWQFTVNQAFSQVIQHCQMQPRKGQPGTWITPEMIAGYENLFRQGHILSLECWQGAELIGGIYGVMINQFFAGESMFHLRPNASKMCVWRLVEHLQRSGHTWMDIQMVTPVLAMMGGKYISRAEFLRRRGL